MIFFFLACSTLVSNELGAGQPQAAKLAMRVVMCMALCSGFLMGLAMILLRGVWGHVYSNEKEVVAYIAKMMPVLAISFFIDGIHGSLSGGRWPTRHYLHTVSMTNFGESE